jgi:hypothetical protein
MAVMSQPDAGESPVEARTSPGRGLLYGALGASAGAIGLAALGGPLSLTAGLLVICFFLGRIVGLLVRTGAGSTLYRRSRASLAVILVVVATTISLGGMWLWAQREGGSLGFVDFLASVYGPLVPLEYAIGIATAWWSAR